MTRRVRWYCPEGCPEAVLGPSRPRADNICRYCLKCSAKRGVLIKRMSPTLLREKIARTEIRERKHQKRKALHAENETAYYTIAGVDLRYEMVTLLAAARTFPRTTTIQRVLNNPPELRVRNRHRSHRGTLGWASWAENWVLINRFTNAGQDEHDVRETLAHELAHILAPYKGHGTAWRTMFRLLCEAAYDIRPRIERRYHGEVSKLLRAKHDRLVIGVDLSTSEDMSVATLVEIKNDGTFHVLAAAETSP